MLHLPKFYTMDQDMGILHPFFVSSNPTQQSFCFPWINVGGYDLFGSGSHSGGPKWINIINMNRCMNEKEGLDLKVSMYEKQVFIKENPPVNDQMKYVFDFSSEQI